MENEVFETEKREENLGIVNTNENYKIIGFNELGGNTNTKTEVITNITDEKKLFNLENKVDNLINDCEGELIRVKEVLIKRYEKPMKEPVIDEETGEILKDKEISMSCVLVDDYDKSYATGSKSFTIQMMKLLQMKSRLGKSNEKFEIRIIRKKVGEKGNKALSFELV